MKQNIPLSYFVSLNDLGKTRYREFAYQMSLEQLKASTPFKSFQELEKRGEGHPPLMSIGQLIDFLAQNGATVNPRNQLHSIVWNKTEELVDHLWEIAVRILEEK